jgi:hypothetical protein
MNTYTDKTQESKRQSVANSVSQKQSSSKSTFQFADNRPEAIAQRKLQEMANNSPKATQLKTLQQKPIQKKENNTGLPDNLKSGIENLSSYSMDDVKVHYNSDKPAQLNAQAYAQGADIHLASGQEKHLAHEAWHVVQQKQIRVKPTTTTIAGRQINDNAGLEREADILGRNGMQVKADQDLPKAQTSTSGNTLQLSKIESALKYGSMGAVAGMGFGTWAGSYIPGETGGKWGKLIGGAVGGVLGGVAGAVYGAQGHWDTVISTASLSPQLRLGLTEAQASPAAKPAPLPHWVEHAVKIAIDYNGQVARKQTQLDVDNGARWDGIAAIQIHNPVKAAWVAAQGTKAMTAFRNGLDLSVQHTINSDFKWNENFGNSDGKLPGVKGAGGYKEYYAPPTPGTTGGENGTWGKNRILRKTSAVGGYANSWWATKDHYNYFYKVG